MDWVIVGILVLVVLVIGETAYLLYLLLPNHQNDSLTKTVSLLSEQLREQAVQLREQAAQAAVDRGERQHLDMRLYKAVRLIQDISDGNARLVSQIVNEFNGVPVYELPSERELELLIKRPLRIRRPPVSTEKRITQHLGEFFNEDELITVAREIGADYENLPGSMKQARAQSLVSWAINRELLEELTAVGKEKRPLLDWSI